LSRKVVWDSSDEKQVADAQKAEKDLDRDLDFILSTERGRRWLYGLIFDACHVRSLSYVPRDTHSSAFNEGARSVGERLLEEVRTRDFAKFMLMMSEHARRE